MATAANELKEQKNAKQKQEDKPHFPNTLFIPFPPYAYVIKNIMATHLTYCGELVRKHDPDRFLLSLFAPERTRPDLWALFAFNHEIAKTRETVTETQLGLIRLQWWREQIGQIYDTGHVSENEVLKALAPAIKKYNLQRTDFETLVYAREFDLEDVLPATTDGMLRYIENINAPLFKLAALIVGADENIHQLAINYGLIRLIYAIPFHASQDRCYLPQDLIESHNINIWSFYKGKEQEKISAVIQVIKGNILETTLTSKFLKSFQHLSMLYLKHLDKNQNDILKITLKKPIKFKELRLFLCSLR